MIMMMVRMVEMVIMTRMVRMICTHVNQLAPLVIGEVPPGQARELFIQGSTKEAQIISHLSIGKIVKRQMNS